MVHAFFVAVMAVTLTGFLMLVHFDHDYLPDMGAASGWTNRSVVHGVGVVALITGFFLLHMLVLHAYVMRVKSYHDFRDMCAGVGGSGRDWPALGKGGAAEAHLLPVLRRGVYLGVEAVYGTVFVIFLVFFVFEVLYLSSPRSLLLSSLYLCQPSSPSLSELVPPLYSWYACELSLAPSRSPSSFHRCPLGMYASRARSTAVPSVCMRAELCELSLASRAVLTSAARRSSLS